MLPIEDIRRILDAALVHGGDLAEIYLEDIEVVNAMSRRWTDLLAHPPSTPPLVFE